MQDFIREDVLLEDDKVEKLLRFYKEYKAEKKFEYQTQLLDDILTKDQVFECISSIRTNLINEFSKKCNDDISTNSEELFQYMMAVSKIYTDNNKIFDFTFVWDILGENILLSIPKENSIMCVEDGNGQEYLGRKYKLIEICNKEDNE